MARFCAVASGLQSLKKIVYVLYMQMQIRLFLATLYNFPISFHRTKEKVYHNRQVGHMLRTKLADANEGGVAAGLGALDSPYLVDV